MAHPPNIWLGLREDAQDVIITALRWDEEADGPYPGPLTERQIKLFSYMADQANTQRLYKTATLGGNTWYLWSLYFDLKGDVLAQVKIELDYLAANYPNKLVIAGGWKWNGEQLADYPPHAQLIQFMPDDPETGDPATEVTDLNLLLGQAPRDFTPVP